MYDVVYIFRGILIGLMVSVPLGPMGVLIIQKTERSFSRFCRRNGSGLCRSFLCYGGGFRIRIRDQCHTDSRVDPTDHRGNFSDYRRIENLFR